MDDGKENCGSYFSHESSYVEEGAVVGDGTRIWRFSHVMPGARIGRNCNIGQNVSIAGNVQIGDCVKVQNNVSVYEGTIVEDFVFLGPSCVLTNISNPRSEITRKALYEPTILRRGSTVGANATIVCNVEIGRYAFVAAGAVVTRDVPDYALVMGNPARRTAWVSRHGHRLGTPDTEGIMKCPESGLRYRVSSDGNLVCLDIGEDEPLPEEMRVGAAGYHSFKEKAGEK